MLAENTVPNGVGTASPPAKLLPPRIVWQELQLPVAASSRPRLMSATSKDCGAKGSIAPSAGRQVTITAVTAPPASNTATIVPMSVALVIRPNGLSGVPSPDPAALPSRGIGLTAC